jgi:hypothetical protein
MPTPTVTNSQVQKRMWRHKRTEWPWDLKIKKKKHVSLPHIDDSHTKLVVGECLLLEAVSNCINSSLGVGGGGGQTNTLRSGQQFTAFCTGQEFRAFRFSVQWWELVYCIFLTNPKEQSPYSEAIMTSKLTNFPHTLWIQKGARGGVVVKALCGFDFRWCHCNFSVI